MPDFSAEIKAASDAAGTTISGNKNFWGTNLSVSKPIYVDGDVEVSGSTFSGAGTICATGSIKMSGSMLEAASSTAVCLYAINGDINLSTSNLEIYSTLYAPNGSINIHASNINIYGRVIAEKILITGSNVNIITDSSDLGFLSGGTIALVE